MPRKREPSWELKTIIWDIAATAGSNNIEAILRQLDYELERHRKDKDEYFSEDTPDRRTIKRIIENDINALTPEVVISKLPQHVWHLRNDYTDIKQLSEEGLTEEVDTEEHALTEEMREHDREVFKKSDEILNEDRLDTLIHRLLIGNRYYFEEIVMLFRCASFFEKESNKYVIPNLRQQCVRCCKMIDRLSHFIEIHSYDLDVMDDELGMKYKLIAGGDYDRFYNNLIDGQIQKVERIFSNKADRIARECRHAYKEYRSTVRETLYL